MTRSGESPAQNRSDLRTTWNLDLSVWKPLDGFREAYASAASIHVCISCTSYAPRQLSKALSHTLLGCGVPVCLSVSFEEHAQDVHHLHEL